MPAHIGLLFGKRLDTSLLRHRIRKYPDSPVHMLSDSLRAGAIIGDYWGLIFFFFSAMESGFKNIRIRCRIRRMRVDGSRIRKENVADSKISGYVWTRPKPHCQAEFQYIENRLLNNRGGKRCPRNWGLDSLRSKRFRGVQEQRITRFLILALAPISRGQNPVLSSFFAPQPNGNACYVG